MEELWKNKDIMLMADMDEYISNKDNIYGFCQWNNLIDSISLLNPELEKDLTYLWGPKRIDYIFINPSLTKSVLKAGHHHFNQKFISYYKGVYIQFKAGNIFDTATMDRSHASYRRLRMGRRDIVNIYIG